MKDNKNNQLANRQGFLGDNFVVKKSMDNLRFLLANDAGLTYCGDGSQFDENDLIGDQQAWDKFDELTQGVC